MLRVGCVEQGKMNAVEVSLLERPETAERSSPQKSRQCSGAVRATTRNSGAVPQSPFEFHATIWPWTAGSPQSAPVDGHLQALKAQDDSCESRDDLTLRMVSLGCV